LEIDPANPTPSDPAPAPGRDCALAAALCLGFLLLYHANGDFLPGNDATANLFLPLGVLHDGSLSFTPERMPQMFIWRLKARGQTRPTRVPAWDDAVDAEVLAWLRTSTVGADSVGDASRRRAQSPTESAPTGPEEPGRHAPARIDVNDIPLLRLTTWRDLRDLGLIELAQPEYYLVPSCDPPAKGYVNQYGPGAGLTALPVFAVLDWWTGDLGRHPAALWYGGKFVAALCVAASVALVFLTLVPLVGRSAAAAIAVAYGAGTCVWSVSSQTLWQSGPNVLCLALAAFCLMRIGRSAWWAAGCGAAAGWAVVCRPTAAVVVAAIGAYLAALAVHRIRNSVGRIANPSCRGENPSCGRSPDRTTGTTEGLTRPEETCRSVGSAGSGDPRRTEDVLPLVAFVLGGLPFALGLAVYNAYYLGSPLRFGQVEAGKQLAERQLGTADAWAGPFWEGFYGLLVSPSRGLLVYSPILILAGWGMFRVWRDPRFERLRPLSVAVVLLLVLQAPWFNWHGGWSFGYRLMVDAMPLAALCAAAVVEPIRRQKALLGAAGVLLAWSLGVQAIGAYAYDVVGWNCREALMVLRPDGAGVVVSDPQQAADVARQTGGAVQKVYMDVDRRAFHSRLWSIRDNQLVYYATHLAEARRNKQRLIAAVIEPPGSLGKGPG
jgi:hypothetical protein